MKLTDEQNLVNYQKRKADVTLTQLSSDYGTNQ